MNAQPQDNRPTSMTSQEQRDRIGALSQQLLDALGDYGNELTSHDVSRQLPEGFLATVRRIDNTTRAVGDTNYGALLAIDAAQRNTMNDCGVRFATELFSAYSALKSLEETELNDNALRDPSVQLLIAVLRGGILTIKGFVYQAARLDNATAELSQSGLIGLLSQQPKLFAMLTELLPGGVALIKALPQGYELPLYLKQRHGDHPANNISVNELLVNLRGKIRLAGKASDELSKLR